MTDRQQELPALREIMKNWAAETFYISTVSGPDRVIGWTYKGLGLHQLSKTVSRYRRKDGTRKAVEHWNLTHLNSGHCVYRFRGVSTEVIFKSSTDLADVSDWDFIGVDGWKNRDPDLSMKYKNWRYINSLRRNQRLTGRNDAVAAEVANLRETRARAHAQETKHEA